MNIVQFLRLINKNILTLFIVPIILAALVFYLTRHETKSYSSLTVIYTGIASGYNIESKGNDKIDFFATNNAFDNLINIIKSRETLEKAAVSLLAQNLMLDKPIPLYLSTESFKELQEIVPQNVKMLVNKKSFDQTFKNLMKLKDKDEVNFVYELLNYSHPQYSIKALSSISVRRVQSSDLVEISYNNSDPGICMQTLILITKSFSENYRLLKEVQTDDVVRYFEEQVARTSNNLKSSEDELLNFNKDNKIINYYEQTKYIASRKEELDVDIQRLQMDFAASVSAISEVEKKLSDKDKIYLKSEEILKKRNKLAAINSRISLTEIYNNEESPKEIPKLNPLKKEGETIQKQLEDDVNQLYLYGHSREGLPLKDLLAQWLVNTIKKEESKASLDVLNKRRAEFGGVYTIFAPLGATLKRIERKIGVTENEYLELLHSLTLAKLKQQNVQLSSALKVVDPPYFPISAKASKRKILIAASAIFGFVLVLIVIVLLEYFDTTIKTPNRAEELLKMKLAGIFPQLLSNRQSKKVNMDFITNRSIELISQTLKFEINKTTEKNINRPYFILVFSTRDVEGKTTIMNYIADKFREFGENVLLLNYCKPEEFEALSANSENKDNKCYKLDKNLFEISNINVFLFANNIYNYNNYKYVFIEFPSIINNSYPADIVREADYSMIVCRANRSWNKADDNVLNLYKEISNNKIISILNGVELYLMETILGEIPRKRSRLRRIIKKIINFQFYERHSIKK